MIAKPKGLGVFGWKRMILTVAVLLLLNGVMAWFQTPQEEDPQLAPRDGIVTVIYPGAPPADLYRAALAGPLTEVRADIHERLSACLKRLQRDEAPSLP